LIVFTIMGTSIVSAQYYGGPGGQISGFVYGVNGGGVDWTQISANNGTHIFHAFSGMSGFYLMRVPVGVYNVSVYVPDLPLWANSANVTITDGSSVTVNFHLQQQPVVVVPEFQTNVAVLVMTFAFAAAVVVVKRKPLRELVGL
jgi:hypothetical protein